MSVSLSICFTFLVCFLFLSPSGALHTKFKMMLKSSCLRSRARLFPNLFSTVANKETSQYMEVATRLWVDRFVFGQGMCPWSGSVLVGNKMKICTLYGDGRGKKILEFTESIIKEIELLHDNDSESDPTTTLIVIPDFKKFDDFLDLIDILNGLLEVDGIGKQKSSYISIHIYIYIYIYHLF
jgi:hypothetical protein